MNETTENFWQVFNNLEPWAPPVIFWRLHYDEAGRPLFYTQENKPGNYIDVTPEQYQLANMQVRVQAGKLIELSKTPMKKKTPSDTGTPCYPNDVSIVVPESQKHQRWRTKTNDAD